MNILDHSVHSRGFPSKLFNFRFGRQLLSAYLLLYRSRPALGETFRSWALEEWSRELRHSVKSQCLFTSVVTLKRGVDRSDDRRLTILPAQSEISILFGVQLKGNLSRALVDWERTSSFSNAVSWLCALAHALPPVIDDCFPVPSFAFPALASSARTVPVLVSSLFRIRYRISPSFPRALALLKMFPKLGRLYLLHYALFEQLGRPLDSCCYSRLILLLELCCFALHSLPARNLCVYMQANDSPNLPCTSLPLSDVLQRNLLGKVEFCFNIAVAWVFL